MKNKNEISLVKLKNCVLDGFFDLSNKQNLIFNIMVFEDFQSSMEKKNNLKFFH